VASYLATQAIFSFTVAPFVLLTLPASLTAWSRVYFYAVVAVAASLAFFASPAKPYLRRRLEQRAADARAAKDDGAPAQPGLPRSASADDVREPVLGLSTDPEREVGEMVREIRDEVERRQAAAAAARKDAVAAGKTR